MDYLILEEEKLLSFEKIAKSVAKKYSCTINYIKMPNKVKKHYQRFTKANISKIKKHLIIRLGRPNRIYF